MTLRRWLSAAAGATGLAVAIAACSNDSPITPTTPTAKAGVCNYLVSPTNILVGGSGSASISVNAVGDSACQWTASTTDEFIHFAGANTGQGSGVVGLKVDMQSLATRHGTVTVIWTAGGAAIGVDMGCWSNKVTKTVNLNAESQIYLTSDGCTFNGAPIVVDVPWMYFVSTHGGGFQIQVDVDLNTGPERTGHITTAIGVITIVQAPGNCVTALTPASQTFDANGGSGSFTVTALPGCSWEATPHDNGAYKLPWSHGSGNGQVTFTMPPNRGPDTLSWYYIVGATSRFQITESGCGGLTVSPLNLRVPAAGGDFSVAVTGGSLCAWSDYSNDAFIMRPFESRTGPGTVEFRVGPNDTGRLRGGSLNVARQTVSVTQDP